MSELRNMSQPAWSDLEEQVRLAFRDWAYCRLHLVAQSAGPAQKADPRFERLAQLAASTYSSQDLANTWSRSLDATGSQAKAKLLTQVLRTGEVAERFLERVIRLLCQEPAISSELFSQVVRESSTRRDRTKKWTKFSFELLGMYERRLPRFDLPENLELLAETALYALYVAWSPQSKVVLPDNRKELLRALAANQDFAYVVTPRRFEELVGYIYEQLGCRAQVTEASGDWGADVLAWQPGPFGTESLIVVQTKLYSAEHKVSLAGIHALHGAVTHYNADHAHLVATAELTGPAKVFMDKSGYKFIDLSALHSEVLRLLGNSGSA